MRRRGNRNRRDVRKPKVNHLLNERITFSRVILINENGENLGIVTNRVAQSKAQEAELDLLCVSSKAQKGDNVPVCKIIDYGKYKFETQKKERQHKKNQQKIVRKEYRIGILTSEYDLSYRRNQIIESLKKGFHVKISLKLFGRYIGMEDAGVDVLTKLLDELKEYADVDKAPERSSKRFLDTYIVPNKIVLQELKLQQKLKKEARLQNAQQSNKDEQHENDKKIVEEKDITIEEEKLI